MKIFKYILIAVAVFGMTSCSKYKTNWLIDRYLDEGDAQFQLFKVVPQTATTANYNYMFMLNNDTIVNNAASLITTYNAIPSGAANIYYTYKTGTLNIKAYASSANTLVYDKSCTLKSGKQTIWIYDYNEDPIVIAETDAPANLSTDNDTISGVAKQYYNFIFDNGKPCDFKIQLYEMPTELTGSDKTKYVKVGEPIGFGESTGWFVSYVKKTSYNASGSATRYMSFKKVVNGVEEDDFMTYTNSSGKTTSFNDYWTEYQGRAVRRIARGDVSSKTTTFAVTNFYAR